MNKFLQRQFHNRLHKNMKIYMSGSYIEKGTKGVGYVNLTDEDHQGQFRQKKGRRSSDGSRANINRTGVTVKKSV